MNKSTLIISILTGAIAGAQTPTSIPQPPAPTTNTNSSTTGNLNTTPATPNQRNAPAPPVAPAATPDTDLNARVKRDLMSDPNFSSFASGITVENLNGQLTLRGQVPSREAEMNLINRASQSSGISSINNQLTVVPMSPTQSR